MAELWSTVGKRGVGAGHVDDRGYAASAVAYTADERARAVRAVASRAVDAEDCAQLLATLGLDPSEGAS